MIMVYKIEKNGKKKIVNSFVYKARYEADGWKVLATAPYRKSLCSDFEWSKNPIGPLGI